MRQKWTVKDYCESTLGGFNVEMRLGSAGNVHTASVPLEGRTRMHNSSLVGLHCLADKYKKYDIDWKPNYDNGKGYKDRDAYVSSLRLRCPFVGWVAVVQLRAACCRLELGNSRACVPSSTLQFCLTLRGFAAARLQCAAVFCSHRQHFFLRTAGW